jgi:hypothetical protein
MTNPKLPTVTCYEIDIVQNGQPRVLRLFRLEKKTQTNKCHKPALPDELLLASGASGYLIKSHTNARGISYHRIDVIQ